MKTLVDRQRFRDALIIKGQRVVRLDCKHPNRDVCAWLGDAKRHGRPCVVCGFDPGGVAKTD